MIELEKKMLLSKEDYNCLIKYFSNRNRNDQLVQEKQINYYFDTDDLSMNQKNITCRIRLKNGRYKGIIKCHSNELDQSTETEIEIRDGVHANTFTDIGLKLQGELTTYRCVILKDDNCEVVLDKNDYLDHTDYELEIEYSPHYQKKAESLLHIILDILAANCKHNYSKRSIIVPSKSARFFERKVKK